MSTALDPIVSEFATQEQADSYDQWFRAKVHEALVSDKPRVAHDDAMQQVEALLEQRRAIRAARSVE